MTDSHPQTARERAAAQALAAATGTLAVTELEEKLQKLFPDAIYLEARNALEVGDTQGLRFVTCDVTFTTRTRPGGETTTVQHTLACYASQNLRFPRFSLQPEGFMPDLVAREVRCMTSGGSTGRPKLIVDLVPALCDPEVAENGMRAGGATLVPGPLYHAGPFMTSWQQLLCGGTVVLMTRFDAEAALALVERHRVEWVLFVPTMMQRIWRLPEDVRTRFDLSSLRRVMSTGAPSPEWMKRAWIEWIGAEKVFEAYGGTERTGGTMISGVEWLAHPGSVGRPTAGRKIRVLRSDGAECAPREIGEVFMMPPGGQGSTYRYIGAEPVATGDGWETLGDMGFLDEEGFLYLVERKSDMILVGGANIYPAEIEAALDAHPAVRSSAVIGLPDDDLGSRVHAIVDATSPLGADELRAHLEKHLVVYKIPRSFEFVSEPLRDDAGKVRRSALREERLAQSRSAGGLARE